METSPAKLTLCNASNILSSSHRQPRNHPPGYTLVDHDNIEHCASERGPIQTIQCTAAKPGAIVMSRMGLTFLLDQPGMDFRHNHATYL